MAAITRRLCASFCASPLGLRLIHGFNQNSKAIGTALVTAGIALILFSAAVGFKGLCAPGVHVFSHFNPKTALGLGVSFGLVAVAIGRFLEDKSKRQAAQ